MTRCRRGWRTTARGVVGAAFLLVLVSMGAQRASAQSDAAADSSQTGAENLATFSQAASDTSSAAVKKTANAAADTVTVDQLRAQLKSIRGISWLSLMPEENKQRPTVKGGFNSSQSSYGPYLDMSLPLLVAGGFASTSTYHREQFEEPATQQKKYGRSLSSGWTRPMSDWGSFSLNLNRQTSESERVGFAKSSSENTMLSSSLKGALDFGDSGIDSKWSIKGNIQNNKLSSGSRSGAGNSTLNTGSFSVGAGRMLGDMSVALNAGLDLAAGPQTLSAATDGSDAQSATKTSTSDTLGVNLVWSQGTKQRFSALVSRQVFDEKRLDYQKDFRGVSIFDPDTHLKIVGNEKENRNVTSINLTAQTPLFRSLRTKLTYGYNSKETRYRLSEQGFIPEQSQNFSGDLYFQYAQAGSLKVSLGLSQNWDDRRARDTNQLRGKHFSNRNEITFTLDQHVVGATGLKLLYGEDLTQQVYDYKLETGTLDTDVLSKRMEAKLTSNAFSQIDVSVVGTYKTTANVFLDGRQVANNNRDQNTWKVTGDYRWQLSSAVAFAQSYQLGIDYTDYLYSYVPEVTQRDKFYKRTQLKSELNLTFPGAVGFTLSHTIDRTRGGNKLLLNDVEASGYADDTSRRQDEQRLKASMKVPLVLGYIATVETNRTFRTLQGTTDEFLGDLRTRLKGTQSFLNNHLLLSMDLGYVWAYGPPRVIRIDRDRRYFTSSTYVSWTF